METNTSLKLMWQSEHDAIPKYLCTEQVSQDRNRHLEAGAAQLWCVSWYLLLLYVVFRVLLCNKPTHLAMTLGVVSIHTAGHARIQAFRDLENIMRGKVLYIYSWYFCNAHVHTRSWGKGMTNCWGEVTAWGSDMVPSETLWLALPERLDISVLSWFS